MKKVTWIVFAALAFLTGLYPLAYFIVDRKFGLLSSKTSELLADPVWNTTFYLHICLGGLALLIGWLQFNKKLRVSKPKVHRNIGKVYVISAIISGLASLYIGWFATGGIVSMSGFISLGLIWLTTTSLAYLAIKKGDVKKHQNLMIYSYAACFAAVTLRIWLPILTAAFSSFAIAYPIVSWLCWVPNIIVAYFIVRKNNRSTQRI